MKLHRIFALVSLAVVTYAIGHGQDLPATQAAPNAKVLQPRPLPKTGGDPNFFAGLPEDTVFWDISFQAPKFPYPHVAQLARVQGKVELEVILEKGIVKSVVKVDGPNMLTSPLTESQPGPAPPSQFPMLKQWKFDESLTGTYYLTYEFNLLQPALRQTRVEKGDSFDRFFLRLFRRPTYYFEFTSSCDGSGETTVETKKASFDPIIRIRVTAPVICLQV